MSRSLPGGVLPVVRVGAVEVRGAGPHAAGWIPGAIPEIRIRVHNLTFNHLFAQEFEGLQLAQTVHS